MFVMIVLYKLIDMALILKTLYQQLQRFLDPQKRAAVDTEGNCWSCYFRGLSAYFTFPTNAMEMQNVEWSKYIRLPSSQAIKGLS